MTYTVSSGALNSTPSMLETVQIVLTVVPEMASEHKRSNAAPTKVHPVRLDTLGWRGIYPMIPGTFVFNVVTG